MKYVERYSREAPYILITGSDDDDLNAIESSLKKIKSKPIGNTLLKKIEELSDNGRFVKIACLYRIGHTARPMLTESQLNYFKSLKLSDNPYDKDHNSLASYISRKPPSKSRREGTSAYIEFDPTQSVDVDNGEPKRSHRHDLVFVSLVHELIHSLRFLKGNSLAGYNGDSQDPSSPAMEEEYRAVGLGRYADRPITENTIRAEHGLQLRKSYLIPRRLQNVF